MLFFSYVELHQKTLGHDFKMIWLGSEGVQLPDGITTWNFNKMRLGSLAGRSCDDPG